VWSWGINDNAALGRDTTGQDVETEELEAQPLPVQDLDQQGFRAVRVAAGDSISLAISDKGEVRAWGSFRVSMWDKSHLRCKG
jgi:regulator of chromosome condensation